MKIQLTYFKPSGKYYSSGEMEFPDDTEYWDVFYAVRDTLAAGKWPGLIDGVHEFTTLVENPKYGVPHIFHPPSQAK